MITNVPYFNYEFQKCRTLSHLGTEETRRVGQLTVRALEVFPHSLSPPTMTSIRLPIPDSHQVRNTTQSWSHFIPYYIDLSSLFLKVFPIFLKYLLGRSSLLNWVPISFQNSHIFHIYSSNSWFIIKIQELKLQFIANFVCSASTPFI